MRNAKFRAAGDPAVRAALGRGRRAHARAARPRRGQAEAGARDPARSARPPGAHRPPRRAGLGRRPPAERGRLAPDLRLGASAPPRPRTGSGLASSSSPNRRRTASPPTWWRSTSTASTSCSSARPVNRPTSPVPRSSRRSTLVRGEVLEDEPYAAWALDLRGSYQGRVLGARLDAADAALAELDFAAALAHTEAAAALDRFSERAHRTEMLALYALGRAARGARSLPHLPDAARRRARARADRRDAGARIGRHPPRGRPLAAASPDRARARRGRPDGAFRLLGRTDGARDAHRCGPARARRRSRPDPDRRRDRARQDAAARRARRVARRTSASDGRAAQSSSGTCRTCRSRLRSATRSPTSSSTLATCRRSVRSCPS